MPTLGDTCPERAPEAQSRGRTRGRDPQPLEGHRNPREALSCSAVPSHPVSPYPGPGPAEAANLGLGHRPPRRCWLAGLGQRQAGA